VSDTLRKTPILGSIPLIKWAFNKQDKTTRQVELMVFLRPRVVRNDDDARRLMKDMDEKFPLIKKWKDGIPPDTKDKKGKKKNSKE